MWDPEKGCENNAKMNLRGIGHGDGKCVELAHSSFH